MSRPLIKRVDWAANPDPLVIPFVFDNGERGWLSLPPRPLTRSEGDRLKQMVEALVAARSMTDE